MDQTVVGWLLVVGSIVGGSYSMISRAAGFHQDVRWRGGGTVSLTGAISGYSFVGFGGAVLLTNNPVWIVGALCAWLVGYVSQSRENRRHRREVEARRKQNSLNHPGIFDTPPPTDLDAVSGDMLALYDAGMCTYLGMISKADIKAVMHSLSDIPDQGPNDLFIMHESLEMIPESQLSQAGRALLIQSLDDYDDLYLRWMPPSQRPR